MAVKGGLAGGDPGSLPKLKALYTSSQVLTRRVEFTPAVKRDAHSAVPLGLVPLNAFVNPLKSEASFKDQQPSPGREVKDKSSRVDYSDIQLAWPTARKVGAGLTNLGNTCFLNSVLQCLTYTPPLVHYLESGQHRANCRVAGFCALCTLEAHVKRALSGTGGAVAPNLLVRNLRSINRSFRIGRQEDAHEFARYFIEALQKCCVGPSSGGPNSKPSPQKEANSFIQRAFGGRLRSQVRCSACQYCSNTYDPFLDLSLEITRADSLLKALQRFTTAETLDGDNKYKCSRCKKKVRAVKQFTIETAPPVLTVQLKRFDHSGGFGGKLDKRVDFGTSLNLDPFLSSSHGPSEKNRAERQGGSCSYQLYAVLVHAGRSTHSGHYYCFVRTAAGVWHAMDDSRVRQVSEKTVLEQRAYMLFYVRTAPPKPPATPPKSETTPSATPTATAALKLQLGEKAETEALKVAKEQAKTVLPDKLNGNKDSKPVEAEKLSEQPTKKARTEERVPVKETAAEKPRELVGARPVQQKEGAAEVGLAVQNGQAGETSDEEEEAFVREEEAEEEREQVATSSWDAYYRDQWAMVPSAYHRLLRVMPSTRRYYLAQRALAYLSFKKWRARLTEETSEDTSDEDEGRTRHDKPTQGKALEVSRSGNETQQQDEAEGSESSEAEDERDSEAATTSGEASSSGSEASSEKVEDKEEGGAGADKGNVKRERFSVGRGSWTQYGAQVPSWDQEAGKLPESLPRGEAAHPKRRYDEWDMAYDQGRTKKVRTKLETEHVPDKGSGAAQPTAANGSNAFQAFLNEKAAHKEAERQGRIEKRATKKLKRGGGTTGRHRRGGAM